MLVKLQAFSLQLNEKLRSQAYFHEISSQKLSAFSAYFNSVAEHLFQTTAFNGCFQTVHFH